jgi:choline dehydrogenase
VIDLPVGEGLQDHPALGILALARDADDLDRHLVRRVMARASLTGVAGAEDFHIFGPFTGEGTRSPIPHDGFVIAGMIVKPESCGWVRLRSTDPSDPPRITLNYFAEPSDLEPMAACLLAIEDVLAQPALQKMIASLLWRPSEMRRPALDEAVRAGALTDHHPTGTAAIGTVLDPHLRVLGIEGLRVCDASVLPETPRANTNFPAMMVAERFVELLDSESPGNPGRFRAGC